MYLQSDRIRLRAFELDRDLALLHQWENDSASWSSAGTLNPLSRLFAEQVVLQSPTAIVERGQMSLAIEPHGAPAVGYVQILDYDPISHRAGMGIYITPEARRQGYASEALALAARYATARLGCRMLYASILASSAGSIALFEHLGYLHTATLPRWHWQDGAYHDLHYYQLWTDPS